MSHPLEIDFETQISRENTGSIKWERYSTPDVLPMWIADMEFATPPQVITAIQDRLDHPLLGYTQATDGLVATVTNYLHNRHHWTIDPQWLSWTPGVLPAIGACTSMLQADEEIIVFTPAYHPLLLIPEKNHRKRVDVPLAYADGRWQIDLDAFRNSINRKSRLLLLCSPHNPVGAVFSPEELRQVVEICASNNILVVSDEIHCDLVLHPDKTHTTTGLIADELQNQVITLMSPSKTYNLAGANCSFSVIPDAEIRKQFNDQCMFNVPLVPTLSYVAAEAAYTHGWDWHTQLITHLRSNLELLKNEINSMPYLWMDDLEATYLAWINTEALPVDNACDYFLSTGVALSPGAHFGDPRFQRLNFACSREQLNSGIERIRKAVEALQ